MKTIFELNQSQANGITYAASHILRRIKARAWSLKAARKNITDANKADLGVMSHFDLLDDARSYFREGLEMHADSAAVFEVYRKDHGWADKSPIVVDLEKMNAGDWA